MTTIKDIAKTAGVSVGTVSNYLNNPELLSEKTRNKIAQTITKLNYNPSAAARSLKTNRTMRIGLVHRISLDATRRHEMNEMAFLELLSIINAMVAENGYELLLSAATKENEELMIIKKLVGEKQVDGLIFMATLEDDERISYLCGNGFPFVCFGRTNHCERFSFVDVDGENGIVQAINYLVSLGHQRIAYLTPPSGLMFAQHRWKGFCKAMMDHKISIDEDLITNSGFDEKSGQIAISRLLSLPQPPTAVIAPNDICAFGVMKELQDQNLKPGEDISVIGFDDIRLSSFWNPPLTTLAQPFYEIGNLLVSMLIGEINGDKKHYQKILAPQLVVRMSSNAVKEVNG